MEEVNIECLPLELLFTIFDRCLPSAFFRLKKTTRYIRSACIAYHQDLQKYVSPYASKFAVGFTYSHNNGLNVMHGKYTQYYHHDKPLLIQYFWKGKRHGPRQKFYNARYEMKDVINIESMYVDHFKNGWEYEYDSGGYLISRRHYQYGKMEGVQTDWVYQYWDNQELHYVNRVVTYKNGMRQGIEYRSNFIDPKLKAVYKWKNDQLVAEIASSDRLKLQKLQKNQGAYG